MSARLPEPFVELPVNPTAADLREFAERTQRNFDALQRANTATVSPGAVNRLTGLYAGSWRNFGGATSGPWLAGYRRVGQRVRMQGLVDKNGGNFVAGDPIVTLPVGFRPQAGRQHVILAAMAGGGLYGSGHLWVMDTGVVQIGDVGGPANPVTWVSLEAVDFPVSD